MTITEAQQDISTSENMDSTADGGTGSQPKPGLGQLWLAILALAAFVALGVAVALGAFDSSSQADGTVTVADPRSDADFHRTPAIQGLDSDYYRETNQQASKAVASVAAVDPRLDADSHRDAPAQPAMDSDSQREINQQASKAVAAVDPRLDADSHREINQQASPAETPHYVSGGLSSEEFWTVYDQANNTVDPRQDADHHREASNS